MLIANPIYDVVFKYLLKDNKIAKLFLGAIIGEKIDKLDFRPQEYSAVLEKKKSKKLKNFVNHITVAFLVAIVSISTMGVSVNTLYCFCTGKSETSFFDIDHTCEKESFESVTHSESFSKLHPCCQKALKEATCAKHKKDCTKKTKKHIKADLKFLEIKKTEVPIFSLYAEVPLRSFSENYDLRSVFPVAKSEALPRPPPPQYWGRKWLNFIQVYRC